MDSRLDLRRADAASLLRVLADDSPDLTVAVDEQGTIGYASAASAPLLGVSPEDAVGTSLLDYCHPSGRQRLERLLATCVGGESPACGQVRIADTPVETSSGPALNYRREAEFTIRDGRDVIGGLVVTVHDISERVMFEDSLMRKQALDAVGRLAGGVAHDFNNLLVVINGYSDFLASSPNLDADERETVAEISAAGDRAARLTSQLLSFSRKQMSSPRVQDANALVTDLAEQLRQAAGSNQVVFSLQEELCLIDVDERQFKAALLELVSNAAASLAARDDGLIEVSVARPGGLPAQFEEQPGNYVAVGVRDNGPGMDDETHAHIFDPFFTTKDVGQGTGLGLSTVHGFVKQSHGYIVTDTEPGEGAVFILCFPEASGEVELELDDTTPAVDTADATILLVEDDETVRSMVSMLLRHEGYRVLEAGSCLEAERAYKAHGPITLLLTDMLLPDQNGQEVSKRLRELEPSLPVLFMSGYAGETNLVSDASTGFLQKPFTKAALSTKLAELLADRLPRARQTAPAKVVDKTA